MKNRQKGFIVPLLITVIALLVVGGGIYLYLGRQNPEQITSTQFDTEIVSSSSDIATSTNQITRWKTYTNPESGFSFQYPSNWPAPTKEILGSSMQISTAGLYIENRSNYNNTIGRMDTFRQFVSERTPSSSQTKDITIGGKDAVEIIGNNLDNVFVAIDSASTLTISNNKRSIDPNIFTSIISSFTFNVSNTAQTATIKSSNPFLYGESSYSFEEFSSPDEDWQYTLKLTSNTGKMRGELIINGFQTQTDIDTIESQNKDGSYNVYFDSNNDGTESNLFTKEDILFILVPITDSNFNIRWVKLQPQLKTNLNSSIFKFIK